MSDVEEWLNPPVKSDIYYLRGSIRMFKKHAKNRQRFINAIDNGEWDKINIPKDQQEYARAYYRKEIRYDMNVIKETIEKINLKSS